MKKILLITFLAFVGMLNLQAQNVTIPDANFKTYLVGNTNINTNADTEIQLSEATTFNGTIDCSSLMIANMSGIEAFTSLNILYCLNNVLTNLDVSNNTLLTELYCDANQLISLDLSTNVSLISLTCNTNPLTSLDLSNNPVLSYLEASGCDLASIIGGVGLEYVTLSSNPNLNNVDFSTFGSSLSTLSISECGFTSLNLSTHGLLSYLYCHSNSISTLNLSANISLYYLDCNENSLTSIVLTGLTNLYQARVYDNNLNTLDVSTCTGLKILQANDNQLASIDLSNNIILEEVFLYENNLTNCQLPVSSTLFKINLLDNALTNLDASMCNALTILTLNNNNLSSLNIANGNNTNITMFIVYNNPDLICIEVDDVVYSTTNMTGHDATASYSLDCGSSASINENATIELLIYPNPASTVLSIESDATIESINIYDLNGTLVKTETSNQFPVENLESGMYILTMTTEQGVASKRFVKN